MEVAEWTETLLAQEMRDMKSRDKPPDKTENFYYTSAPIILFQVRSLTGLLVFKPGRAR